MQEFQDIEAQSAAVIFQQALALCNEFGVSSQRAVALLFDIKVQTGGIKSWVKPHILSAFEQLDQSGSGDVPLDVARLRIIATRSEASANPKWVADLQNRKLTIANGEGTVHGNHYDLGVTVRDRLKFRVQLKAYSADMRVRNFAGSSCWGAQIEELLVSIKAPQ